MSHHAPKQDDSSNVEPFGILAEFKGPTELVAAAKKIRDAGFTKWDCHSPFPVHGIDPAMGIKPTILPWIVLGAGLTGLGLAVLMQWWMNAIDYPYVISGKPFFSLPANVPVMFELTVLLAGLTTFFGVLMLNMLPEHYHPLFKSERFKRATSDGFFVAIEASDAKYNRSQTEATLRALGATHIEIVMGEPKKAFALPKGFVYVGLIATSATLVPLAMFADARHSTSRAPRVHLIPDMDSQPKDKAQAASSFGGNVSAYRDPVEGAVAVGELRADDAYYLGGPSVTTFPAAVDLSEATLARGEQQFGVFCAPCHGLAGAGDGMVARRADALKLQGDTWVPPTAVFAPQVVSQPVGQIFASISNGVRNMPGYAAQISTGDRWAIVMYVRALQKSQSVPLANLPEEVQSELKNKLQ